MTPFNLFFCPPASPSPYAFPDIARLGMKFLQEPIYSCGGLGVIRMEESLSLTRNLCYNNYFTFVLVYYSNLKHRVTFRDFRAADTYISITVNLISVCGDPGVITPVADP
jgi:hypothetical protein